MSSYTLNIEDLRISLKDLAGMMRFISYVFMVPVPVAVYWVTAVNLGGGITDPSELAARIASTPTAKIFDVAVKVFFECLAYIIPAGICLLISNNAKTLKTAVAPKPKHLLLSVAIGGLLISLVGALPFIVTQTLSPLDAWFESTSGWSATGLTMVEHPENMSRDLLFYRSLSHWAGGLGIIAVSLAVFMKKGTVASSYYGGDSEARIKPSMRGMINETWKIYLVYTVACLTLLYLTGMSLFDAVNHAMSAVSSGGFSTHSGGVGYFQDNVAAQAVILFFMVLSSISILLHFRLFEGRINAIAVNAEIRYMIVLLIFSTVFITVATSTSILDLGKAPDALFQVVSAISSSGFSTTDIKDWPEVAQLILVLLMFVGGMYGSTTGGIKLLRLVVVVETIAYSFKKLVLPKTAIIRVKIGGTPIEGAELLNSLGLSAAYLVLAVLGTIILMFNNMDVVEASFMTASAMSNVGLVNMYTSDWFAINSFTKITLIILMWAGRIEIFPAMILATSLFRKTR